MNTRVSTSWGADRRGEAGGGCICQSGRNYKEVVVDKNSECLHI